MIYRLYLKKRPPNEAAPRGLIVREVLDFYRYV
jgi:hypothetical protein